MSSQDARLLEVRDAKVSISGVPIIHGADLELDRGKLLTVVGPNGAGKSTLVRAAAGLQKLTAGQVLWSGEQISRLRSRHLARLRAFIPQRPLVPSGITVRQAVEIGRSPHLKPLQRLSGADREAAEQAIERCGITHLVDRDMSTLSGGESQRAQIAIALAQDAPTLIADEPTSALDLGATAMIAELLRSLADEGYGVIMVAHDLSLAAAIADSVVIMSGGHAVASGGPEILDQGRLAEVWNVDAELETDGSGRTALHVQWLGGRRPHPDFSDGSGPAGDCPAGF